MTRPIHRIWSVAGLMIVIANHPSATVILVAIARWIVAISGRCVSWKQIWLKQTQRFETHAQASQFTYTNLPCGIFIMTLSRLCSWRKSSKIAFIYTKIWNNCTMANCRRPKLSWMRRQKRARSMAKWSNICRRSCLSKKIRWIRYVRTDIDFDGNSFL